MLLRPACPADLPGLLDLLATAPLASGWLGDTRERLAALIESSEASLASDAGFSGEESYFFVLEEADGSLAGCSALLACAGFAEPFYSYRNETFVHASSQLKIHNRIHVLSLCHDLTGSSLLTACQLQLGAVAAGAGLDLQGRLLFIAAHPGRFAEELVAELAGEQDGSGNSPFWEGVGRNFLALSHPELRQRCRERGRGSLAELLPGYPLYVPLLPDSAQEAIGQVHHSLQHSFDLLVAEGFSSERYVDVFDGGPLLQSPRATTRSIAASRELPLDVYQPGTLPAAGRPCVVAGGSLQAFRSMVAMLSADGAQVWLTPEQAQALGVQPGDLLRVVELEDGQ